MTFLRLISGSSDNGLALKKSVVIKGNFHGRLDVEIHYKDLESNKNRYEFIYKYDYIDVAFSQVQSDDTCIINIV